MAYMKIFTPFLLIILIGCSTSKTLSETQLSNERNAIKSTMQAQEDAWNAGDIDAFMEGYWKSDKLSFTGSRGVTYGWGEVLSNYKESYPDKATMGRLQFDIKELNPLSNDTFHMIGVYTLFREQDTPSGHFTLLWKKIDGKWLIISDHTG